MKSTSRSASSNPKLFRKREHGPAMAVREVLLYPDRRLKQVCPPAQRLGARHLIDLEPSGEPLQAWVDVLDLLDATDDQLIERHGRWYLANRDPVWWRRNALIVLGNVGDPADPRTRRTRRTDCRAPPTATRDGRRPA